MTKFAKAIGNYTIFAIIFSTLFFPSVLNAKTAAKPERIKTIKTMDDLLKLSGIKDSKERKYIEDETKQYLQDEISKMVDPKLDVTVYLQTLDHFAHGESKKANSFLATEIGKKLLENLIGGGFMKVLTAAWDFDKYVWTSVQQWAEKKDMEKYKAFLLEHTKKWDQDRDLWEVERRGARQVFRLWWGDYKNSLGKTKMFKDRQAYYIKFKNDCLWHFRKVTAKYQQAKVAEATLKESAMLKRKAIFSRIGLERENYRRATRVLKRAKQKGDMSKLAKKYWSDKAFRKKINELADKNSTVFLEEETGIFQNTKADIKSVEISAEKAKKAIKASDNVSADKINPPIITLQLEAYQNFLRDYRTLTAKIFSNTLEAMVTGDANDVIVAAAVNDWHRKLSTFQSNVNYVRSYYESYLNSNKYLLDKAKINRLKAEIKKIDTATKAFNTALLKEKTTREKQAVDDMLSLRSQVKKLNHLRAQAEPINKDVRKEFSDREIKLRKEIETLTDKANYKGFTSYSFKPPKIFVNKAVDPLTGMAKYSAFYEQCITAYWNDLVKLKLEIPVLIKASADLRKKRKVAVDMLDDSAKPFVARWLYFAASSQLSPRTGGKIPQEARLSGELNVMPGNWRIWLSRCTRESTNAEGRFSGLLKWKNQQMLDMLEYEMQMEEDFHNERSLHSQAQHLLAGMRALAKPYAKVNLKKPDSNAGFHALNFLRSGSPEREALFTQMINRNHSAMKLIDGSLPAYKSVLSTKTASLYRLDKQPYNAQRRYPDENAKLIKEMELALANVNQAGTTSTQDSSALEKSQAILKKLRLIRNATKLVGSLIDSIVAEADKLYRSIHGAVVGTRISDKDAARKTLDNFKKFVAQAKRNYENDNRTMEGYLKKAKAFITGGFGSQASDQLALAEQHKYMMELYGLNKGMTAVRYNVKIKELKEQINAIGQGGNLPQKKLTPDDVTGFPEGGNYHVTINGISSTTMPRFQTNIIPGKNGEIEIRTESYDPVFRNAKKVMISIFAGSRPKRLAFSTVSRKGPKFVHRLKVPFDKPYTMEIRIVTDKLMGYTPVQYPLGFQWGKMPLVKTGNVKTFRIRKRGEIVKLNGKLNEPLELKFTTGGVNLVGELHVLSLTGKSLYGQQPWKEYAMFAGRWIGLTLYTRQPAASTKFVHYSTEEEENNGTRSWEFRTFIQPNEQYNVFSKVGNKWQLVAYVIGMNIKTPSTPKDNGKNTSSHSGSDNTTTTHLPTKSHVTKLTWGKPVNTTNTGKDITEPPKKVNNTINQSDDKLITVSDWKVKQVVSLRGNWMDKSGHKISIAQNGNKATATAMENKGPVGWKTALGEVKKNTIKMNFNGWKLIGNISSQENTISWSNKSIWKRDLSSLPSIGHGDLGTSWDVTEPYGWKGVWTRRGSSNVFDALWKLGAKREKAVLIITINGNTVNVQRTQSPGYSYPGQKGIYKGTLAADKVSITGTYSCDWAKGPFNFRATIKRNGDSTNHTAGSGFKPSVLLTGKWFVNQSNGYKGVLDLQQKSTGRLSGNATWNGTLFGTIAGNVLGDIVEFTISYPGGVKGLYKGTLAQGATRIVNGTVKGNNGVSAKWDAILKSSVSSGGKQGDGECQRPLR